MSLTEVESLCPLQRLHLVWNAWTTRQPGWTGESMEVIKTASFGVPVLKVVGDVDHLSAQTLEK